MKRIMRTQHLTPDQAAHYRKIREQVAHELPDLIHRHHERIASLERFQTLVQQLKQARQKRGMSLSQMTELTGMDRAALSRLETGQRPNPTLETLIRYAEAVGKHLEISLADAQVE